MLRKNCERSEIAICMAVHQSLHSFGVRLDDSGRASFAPAARGGRYRGSTGRAPHAEEGELGSSRFHVAAQSVVASIEQEFSSLFAAAVFTVRIS